jgi:hypothetical protein
LYFFAREGVIAGACSLHFLFGPTGFRILTLNRNAYYYAKIAPWGQPLYYIIQIFHTPDLHRKEKLNLQIKYCNTHLITGSKYCLHKPQYASFER